MFFEAVFQPYVCYAYFFPLHTLFVYLFCNLLQINSLYIILTNILKGQLLKYKCKRKWDLLFVKIKDSLSRLLTVTKARQQYGYDHYFNFPSVAITELYTLESWINSINTLNRLIH